MRVLSTYGSRGGVEPIVGLAVQPGTLGADLPRSAAELVAAQFDRVAAVDEECDAQVATDVMMTGAWR